MDNEEAHGQPELKLLSVADKLRQAREAAGLSIDDVAAKTRIPLRHLQAMEESRYDQLPGKTYASGFAKAYARTVDLSETEIARELRQELGEHDPQHHDRTDYEPVSQSRLPSRALALTALAIGLVLAGGYAFWRSTLVGETTSEIPIAAEEASAAGAADGDAAGGAAAASSAPAVPANAPIVLTAVADVWVGFNDPGANGRQVFDRTFKSGETYTVPAEAQKWTLRTSRPQALQISVGGKPVPQLGPADLLVKDVPLEPTALVRRAEAQQASTAAPPSAAPDRGSAQGSRN